MKKVRVTSAKKRFEWSLTYPAWATAVGLGMAPTYPRTGRYSQLDLLGATMDTFRNAGDAIHFDSSINEIKWRHHG
jgi:hypothetical protein